MKVTPEALPERAVEYKNRSEEAKNSAIQNAEASKTSYEQIEHLRVVSDENNQEIANYLDQYYTKATEISSIQNRVETQVNSIQINLAEIDKVYANHDNYVEKIKRLSEIFASGDDYDSKRQPSPYPIYAH